MGSSNDSTTACRPGNCTSASTATERQTETAAPLIRPVRAYQLYVHVDRAWSWVCTFEAPTHADAFRQGLACLRGDEHDRPIRLEQDIEGTFCKPCNRGCRPL